MQTIMLKTDDPRLYEASPEKLADFRAQLHQHLTNERPELAADDRWRTSLVSYAAQRQYMVEAAVDCGGAVLAVDAGLSRRDHKEAAAVLRGERRRPLLVVLGDDLPGVVSDPRHFHPKLLQAVRERVDVAALWGTADHQEGMRRVVSALLARASVALAEVDGEQGATDAWHAALRSPRVATLVVGPHLPRAAQAA